MLRERLGQVPITSDQRLVLSLGGWSANRKLRLRVAVVCRLARRSGVIRCGKECSGIVYSVRIGPPQPNLIDSQRLADLIQQAGLVFGKDLGNKSALPSSFPASSYQEAHQVFQRLHAHLG